MSLHVSAPHEGPGTLLVVGGRPDTVRKAVGLGLRVVLLQHKDHFVAETAALAEAVIIADYTDWQTIRPLVVAAHETYGFTAVVSLTEPGLDPVGRINDLLGLRGTSQWTARLLLDKIAMRERLAEAGGAAAAANVRASAVVDEQTLRDFGDRNGYPFIVKPSDITASLGVHRVDGPEEISGVWQAVEALRARTDLPWKAFFTVGPHIVEEFIEGPEYSVEAFSFAGEHVVVAVTEKFSGTAAFIELGHAQPARISEADEAALVECARTFLDAVGLRDGASHTEIKLTADGPKIIEGHNRIGGDRIVDLLELAYGVDFELLTVGWPFRLVEPLTERPKPLRSAVTTFVTAPAGVVEKVEGLDEVRAHPDVFAADVTVRPGDRIVPSSNWGRCGQVVLTGPDTTAALELCTELVDRIVVSVTPNT